MFSLYRGSGAGTKDAAQKAVHRPQMSLLAWSSHEQPRPKPRSIAQQGHIPVPVTSGSPSDLPGSWDLRLWRNLWLAERLAGRWRPEGKVMEGKSFEVLTEEGCHRLLHNNTATVGRVGSSVAAVLEILPVTSP